MKYFMIIGVLVLGLVGCSGQQLANAEAKANRALTVLEAGIDWATANRDKINAGLDAAEAEAADHPAALAAIQKARAANTQGNAAVVHSIVAGGISITQPVQTQ